jgi:hypothetical protein
MDFIAPGQTNIYRIGCNGGVAPAPDPTNLAAPLVSSTVRLTRALWHPQYLGTSVVPVSSLLDWQINSSLIENRFAIAQFRMVEIELRGLAGGPLLQVPPTAGWSATPTVEAYDPTVRFSHARADTRLRVQTDTSISVRSHRASS